MTPNQNKPPNKWSWGVLPTEPGALAGLEPAAWSHNDYGSTELSRIERAGWEPLYSAATVEQLVQERNNKEAALKDAVTLYGHFQEQLATMTGERDNLREQITEVPQIMRQLAAMTQERDAYCEKWHKELIKGDQLAASQAREQQLREALEEVKRHGIEAPHPWAKELAIEALSLPQDDSALRSLLAEGQAREQQLRDALTYLGKEISEGQGVCIETVVEALSLPQDDTALNTLLAEGQAREQQLREALSVITVMGHAQGLDPTLAANALSLPQDDTALRQWGAKLLRDVSEVSQMEQHGQGWISVYELRRKANELRAGK